MQKIVPCVWFDGQAEAAAEFYTSIFPNSKIATTVPYTVDTPSNKPIGSILTVSFTLSGHEFMALNGGPFFKINPSISFIVGCDTTEEIDELWEKLHEGDSKVLMPLDTYPFSERYGWIQDKFGVSWQLIFTSPEGEERPKIVPSLLFVNEKSGKAEEAVQFYISCFKDAKLGNLVHYEEDQGPSKAGEVMFSDFKLGDVWLAAMDGGDIHDFTFNEAVSFMICCKDQGEIDLFYDKFSAVPEAEECGWLKDKYGVSWQLATEDMEELSKDKQVMEAMLKMKRLDINTLREVKQNT